MVHRIYFSSKQDLAVALIKHSIDQWRGYLIDIKLHHKKGLGRLNALVKMYTQDLKNEKLSLSGSLVSELRSLSPAAHMDLQEFFLIIEMWVVQALTLALEQKEIRQGLIRTRLLLCEWYCLKEPRLLHGCKALKSILRKPLTKR